MYRPNILYIHSHDAGRLVEPYGCSVPTPNICRLAEQGTIFRQAFCAAPTCSPSRAALLTGQTPHQAGMFGLAHRGWRLNHPERHIIHTLKPAGYHSILCGVEHLTRPGESSLLGYDEMVPAGKHSAAESADAAEARIKAGLPEPFFLSVGCTEPHRPFPAPETDQEKCFYRAPAPLPDTPETRRDMAGFATLVERFDQMVGRTLKALEDAGLAERTLVICTTDHGPAFPRMKCNLTDPGLGVMLILRGPGAPIGRSTDAMVSQIDVFPTLCDLLEIAAPAWLEGQSFAPVLRGEAEQARDEVFGEVTYHVFYEPQRCVRTPRWKYIRRFDGPTTPVLRNCDNGLTKELFIANGWDKQPLAAEALYDLMFDPDECHNLVDRPELRAIADDLRGRLDRWMRATDDPLLRGPIEAPEGFPGPRQFA